MHYKKSTQNRLDSKKEKKRRHKRRDLVTKNLSIKTKINRWIRQIKNDLGFTRNEFIKRCW